MTTQHDTEYQSLQDLLQSAGWKVFRDLVMEEIAGDFENDITRALDNPDSMIALDRMRQVAAIRKAGLRWLRLPNERMAMLEANLDKPTAAWEQQTRRPVGV